MDMDEKAGMRRMTGMVNIGILLIALIVLPIVLIYIVLFSYGNDMLMMVMGLYVITALMLIFTTWIGYLTDTNPYLIDIFIRKIFNIKEIKERSLEEILEKKSRQYDLKELEYDNQIGRSFFQVLLFYLLFLFSIFLLISSFGLFQIIYIFTVSMVLLGLFIPIIFLYFEPSKVLIDREKITAVTLSGRRKVFRIDDHPFIVIQGVNIRLPAKRSITGFRRYYAVTINPKGIGVNEIAADICLLTGMKRSQDTKKDIYLITKKDPDKIKKYIPDFMRR